VPTGHVPHELAPALLELPTGHWIHVSDEVAPVDLLAVPAGHGVQAPAPAPLYVPAGQVVQAPDPGSLYFPAGHMAHVVTEVAPTALL
jgi:hypothetical protein